jgi:DNA repair protein RecO (recombination protein O)
MPETDAISLRLTPYGEADVIVTLLGASGGKLRGIARGARKSRKRFGAGLDPGNRGTLSYHAQPRSELATIDGFAGSRPPTLGPDPVAGFGVITVALETCDVLSVEGENAARRFTILAELLGLVGAGAEPSVALTWFLATALSDAGFAPRFDGCVRCNGVLGNQARFDAARVAMVCARCSSEAAVATIEPEMAERIAALTPGSPDVEAARTAVELLGAALEHLAGRRLKSLEFVRSTRAG